MAAELDGLNKYLQGVRVPGAIKAQSSYTLQNLRQEEQANRMNQLYRAAARVPAGAGKLSAVGPAPQPATGPNSDTGNQSNVRASTYDVVDEVYQGIDDFEARLGQLRGDLS